MTLTETIAAIRAGKTSAAEVAAESIRRLRERANLNTVVDCDEELWLEKARQADKESAPPAAPLAAPLAGAGVFVKANICTRDLTTSAATPALREFRAKADAPAVRRMVAAGGIVAAKANMHELAFGITSNNAATGAVRNPANPEMIPGGSSGGGAAAVAAGIVPASLGTDTGGSTRIPPALCGCAGFRPTVGRYDGGGVVPLSKTRDTIGPMAASVADLALLDAVLAGENPAPLAAADLKGLRLGVPREYFWEGLDAELEAIADRALQALEKAGAVLVDADIAGVGGLNAAVSFPVVLFETARDLPVFLAENECGISMAELIAGVKSPDVKGVLESLTGEGAIPEAAYREALETHRPKLQAACRACFRENDIAALVYPTTPLPARPIGDDETVELRGERAPTFPTYIRNTDPGSNAGLPGVSVPAGNTSGGLPVGMLLEGPENSDRRVLEIAAAFEAAARRG